MTAIIATFTIHPFNCTTDLKLSSNKKKLFVIYVIHLISKQLIQKDHGLDVKISTETRSTKEFSFTHLSSFKKLQVFT